MSDIFISYSKEDRNRARDVATRLTQEGWSVFLDRRIPVGSTWDEILEKELPAARVIIVLWSNNSVVSEWVRAEAAEGANRKILVPAVLELVTIPIRFRLLQTADITDWKSGESDTEGMRLLIEAVSRIGKLRTPQEEEAMRKAEEEAVHIKSEADAGKKAEAKKKVKVEAVRKKIPEEKLIADSARRKPDEGKGKKDKTKSQARRLAEQEPINKKVSTELKVPIKQVSMIRRLLFLCAAGAFLIVIIYIVVHRDVVPTEMSRQTPSFKSPLQANSKTVIDIDGNEYDEISIGAQIWIAENLKTTRYNDGKPIPLLTDNTAWKELETPAYCWYDNDLNNKDTYGALYNWYTVNTGKLCPKGWHVPTDAEWTSLADYLGGEENAGGKLKETGTVHWNRPNKGATNKSGFTALPGGSRDDGIPFSSIGYTGYWWSATEGDASNARSRYLRYEYRDVYRGYVYKFYGFSVRCLRD